MLFEATLRMVGNPKNPSLVSTWPKEVVKHFDMKEGTVLVFAVTEDDKCLTVFQKK